MQVDGDNYATALLMNNKNIPNRSHIVVFSSKDGIFSSSDLPWRFSNFNLFKEIIPTFYNENTVDTVISIYRYSY